LVREVPFHDVCGKDAKPNQIEGCSRKEQKAMEWTTPKFEEIALNCEINSYASAAL